MKTIQKAPRELIAAAQDALTALAVADLDHRNRAYTRLAKALDGVIPADTPEFTMTCPGTLNRQSQAS